MKKAYEEPDFELTVFHFGRIMGDAGEEELVHNSIINPGAGGGDGGGLE